jgi:hypothetical protein
VTGDVARTARLQRDVGDARGRPMQEGGSIRDDDPVVDGLDDRVVDRPRRLAGGVEPDQERRADGLLLGARAAAERGPLEHQRVLGSVVGRREADQVAHLRRAPEEADVVARHHAALGVADDRDTPRVRAREQAVHEGGELVRRVRDPAHAEVAVVEGEHAVALARERRAEEPPGRRGERAVHQHDRVRMLNRRPAGPRVHHRRRRRRDGGVAVRAAPAPGSEAGGRDEREQHEEERAHSHGCSTVARRAGGRDRHT